MTGVANGQSWDSDAFVLLMSLARVPVIAVAKADGMPQGAPLSTLRTLSTAGGSDPHVDWTQMKITSYPTTNPRSKH